MDYGRVEFPAFQVSKEDLEALNDFCERNSTKKLPEARTEQMRWMISRFLVNTELAEETVPQLRLSKLIRCAAANAMDNETDQEFECEVDRKDRVLLEQDGRGLRISMQFNGDVKDVFLGPGQIDNMIAFLNKLRGK